MISLLSSLAGYCIVVGAFLISVPQIYNVVSNKRVDGLSLPSLLFDLLSCMFGFTINWSLAHPFSVYGELVPILCQVSILSYLVILYRYIITSVDSQIPQIRVLTMKKGLLHIQEGSKEAKFNPSLSRYNCFTIQLGILPLMCVAGSYSLLAPLFSMGSASLIDIEICTVVLVRVRYFVLLNYSYKSWSIIKTSK